MPYTVGQRTVYRVGECREYVKVWKLKDNGYQDYTALKDACRKAGKPFQDPEFDPDDTSRDIIGSVSLLTTDRHEFPKWDGYGSNWTSQDNRQDGESRYSRYDINQGGLGDCWYMTALSLIITQNDLAEFLIPDDNNTDIELGIYHFRIWHKGVFVDVVVDDRLPYWDKTGFGFLEPAFCKLNADEIWPNMMEKAYAKLHHCYAGIDGGWTTYGLEDFTGGYSEFITLGGTQDNLFQKLVENQKEGNFIGFDTVDNDAIEDNGLVNGHAYGMVGIDTVQYNGDTVQLIRLRNPWGWRSLEWNGDWSDNSELWNQVSQEDRDRLLVQKQDGQFWLSLPDAINTDLFFQIDICHWFNDLVQAKLDYDALPVMYTKNYGKWVAQTAAGSETIDAIAKNPQFLVQLKKSFERESAGPDDCMLVVSLLYMNYVEQYPHLPGFGYKIYQVQPNVPLTPPYALDDFKNGNLVDIGSTTFIYEDSDTGYQSSREINFSLDLPSAPYLIVPCTHYADQEGGFLLRTLSEGNFSSKAAASVPTDYTLVLGPQGISTEGGIQLPQNLGGGSFLIPEPPSPPPIPPIPDIPKIPTVIPKPVVPIEPEIDTKGEQTFKRVAGDDKLVSIQELKSLLNESFKQLPNFHGFCDETVRAVLAVSDYNADGKLDYKECSDLYPKVTTWIKLFVHSDTDQDGYLKYAEFSRLLLYKLNISLPTISMQLMYERYAHFRGINLDSFLLAVAKLNVGKRLYYQHKLDGEDAVTMEFDKWMHFATSF